MFAAPSLMHCMLTSLVQQEKVFVQWFLWCSIAPILLVTNKSAMTRTKLTIFCFLLGIAVGMLQATFQLWFCICECYRLEREWNHSFTICRPWLYSLEQYCHRPLFQLYFMQGWGPSGNQAGLAKGRNCKHCHACFSHYCLLCRLLCFSQQQEEWCLWRWLW